jgi:amidophosphoribosyltransferase
VFIKDLAPAVGRGEITGEAQGRNPKAPKFCDACFSGDYPIAPSDKIEEGFEMKVQD